MSSTAMMSEDAMTSQDDLLADGMAAGSVDESNSAMAQSMWDMLDDGFFGDLGDMEFLDPTMEQDSVEPVTESMDTAKITYEDYETGAEQEAFKLLSTNLRKCFVKNTSNKERDAALQWVFVPNHGEIPFDLCCRGLSVRPNLLRLRLQYQFYRNWIVFPNELPFLSTVLPELLAADILFHAGEVGLEAAKEMWWWPGIRADQLMDRMAHKGRNAIETRHALAILESKGAAAIKTGHWYFTGHNPELLPAVSRSRFRWAKVVV